MSNDTNKEEFIDNNDHKWVIVRDKNTGKILYSYDKTNIEYKQKHLEHLINPFEFNRILAKNVRIMNGDLCYNCERDPCEC